MLRILYREREPARDSNRVFVLRVSRPGTRYNENSTNRNRQYPCGTHCQHLPVLVPAN
jgi:hypothetical protein